MSRDSLVSAAVAVCMLAVGAAAWWLLLRPTLDADASALVDLPLQVGEWRGEALPLDSGVERMLDADLHLQRAYTRSESVEPTWLYVGYYSSARGGHPEHTPQVCYPSAGWRVESERRLEGPGDARAVELVVARNGRRRLVHFWYRSSRSAALLGRLEVRLDQLRGRLSDGRADGALIRLSTPIEAGGEEPARERLGALRGALEPELARRWPVETPPP